MKEYIRFGFKRSVIKDGMYWVQTKFNKDLVISESIDGRFYLYNLNDPTGLELTDLVIHFKRITKPKLINH